MLTLSTIIRLTFEALLKTTDFSYKMFETTSLYAVNQAINW